MIIEKQTAEFKFTASYTDKNKTLTGVAVTLTIDYPNKRFTITPYGVGKNFFMFAKSSDNYLMWKVVLKAIDKAIDFANEELDLVPPQKPMPGEK